MLEILTGIVSVPKDLFSLHLNAVDSLVPWLGLVWPDCGCICSDADVCGYVCDC